MFGLCYLYIGPQIGSDKIMLTLHAPHAAITWLQLINTHGTIGFCQAKQHQYKKKVDDIPPRRRFNVTETTSCTQLSTWRSLPVILMNIS